MLTVYCEMQEGRADINDNAAASATSTEQSSPHHFAARDDAVSGQSQSLPEPTGNEVEKETRLKKNGSGGGVHKDLDALEVKEAQQPSVNADLQDEDLLKDLYTLPKKKKR